MIGKNHQLLLFRNGMVNWKTGQYHPVVNLPEEYEVRDFTKGSYVPSEFEYDIGRYDELRPGMYSTDLFSDGRFLHIGIDIGAPVGTPCMAFDDGEVSHFGYNPADGDYGYVIITKHDVGGTFVWALYGHLDAASIEGKTIGQKISRGEIICWMGDKHENGGWDPHLHFQLSLIEPTTHDMPGVVDPKDREEALLNYPDPRLVMGPIY
ncbi:MAG: peptidase M23 [Euryarchaeota archaeon]|nr:peptidase M23 [Euryarchaeota archaeon]|tara:strand:+ start:2769 stop:3392 length:624 start_codon:yes stop_codon:yes gene_type:complete